MIRARLTYASRDVAVDISAPSGTTTVIMGANGAGKSTIAAMLTGLLKPDPGSAVIVDGQDLTALPPYRRKIGLVAQDARLFPRSSVLDNVAYAPRAAGIGKAQARTLAAELLAELGVDDLAQRRADRISGGQAQRVALARALAARPRLLLLDEPFAGLDVEVAAGVRQSLSKQLSGLSTILISHDPTDALLLGDQLVILEQGRVSEVGPPATVLAEPRSAFAARLAQLNLLTGTGSADQLLRTPLGPVHGRGELPPGSPGVAVFSPAAVAVYTERPAGSPRNWFAGTVAGLTPHGSAVTLSTVEGLRAEVTPQAVQALELRAGDPVWLAVKAQQVRLFAAENAGGVSETAERSRPVDGDEQ